MKQGNYEDESGTQWRMSFFRISTNNVKIYRLYQSGSIDESKLKKKLFIENNNAISQFRIMNPQNKQPIRLTESQLSRMFREIVKRVLKEKQGFQMGNGWSDAQCNLCASLIEIVSAGQKGNMTPLQDFINSLPDNLISLLDENVGEAMHYC